MTFESVIENVSFNGMSLYIAAGKLNDIAGGTFDLRPVLDPALQLFSHDIPAFYAQYVKDFKINWFDLTWDEVKNDFFTHGIEVRNFENVTVNRFSGAGAPSRPQALPLFVANGVGYCCRLRGLNSLIISKATSLLFDPAGNSCNVALLHV
jgi:hypothetical protein